MMASVSASHGERSTNRLPSEGRVLWTLPLRDLTLLRPAGPYRAGAHTPQVRAEANLARSWIQGPDLHGECHPMTARTLVHYGTKVFWALMAAALAFTLMTPGAD